MGKPEPWNRQQLGPNWRPQQFGHWRTHGYVALGPSATEILFLVMEGVDNIPALARYTGLGTTSVTGHVRRLTGLGLVHWKGVRKSAITANVRELTIADWGGWWSQ